MPESVSEKLGSAIAVIVLILLAAVIPAQERPGNMDYGVEEVGTILSWVDPGKALSAVALHRNLVIAPVASDHGGGEGVGALVAYNIDDPRNPVAVFDSRDYPERYHNIDDLTHYLGNLAEQHALSFDGDYLLLSERSLAPHYAVNKSPDEVKRSMGPGICVMDLSPLYDDNPETLPGIVCRFAYPNVKWVTNYGGYSFSPTWAGGDIVYAPTGNSGLYVVDTRDYSNPQLLAHLNRKELMNLTLRSAHVIGDILILSPVDIGVVNAEMLVMDVSDPSQPTILSSHPVQIGYQGTIYGSCFYNGATQKVQPQMMKAWDFSDPTAIKEITLKTGDDLAFNPEYVFFRDDKLHLGHYPGLVVYEQQGDAWTASTRLEPQHPPAKDYAFCSPIGNLVAVTSDHHVRSKLNLGVATAGLDLLPPEVRYVVPQSGSTGMPLSTKIGISFSDFIDPTSLSSDTVILRNTANDTLVACGTSHTTGIVNIVPEQPLEPGTQYELSVTSGVRDACGNPYAGELVITRFTTGVQTAD